MDEQNPNVLEQIVASHTTQSKVLEFADKEVANDFLKAQTERLGRENLRESRKDGWNLLKKELAPFLAGCAAGGIVVGLLVAFLIDRDLGFWVFAVGCIAGVLIIPSLNFLKRENHK